MSILSRSVVSFFPVLAFLCLVTPLVYSQASIASETNSKFDEYGLIGQCDHSARLDHFAIKLQDKTELAGYVVYYGPKEIGEATLTVIKDYLVNTRGIDEGRFQRVYAGPNDDLKQPRIQLWLLQPNETLPPFQKYKNEIETFTGLYDEDERFDEMYWGEGEGGGPPVHGVSLNSFVKMMKTRADTVAYIVAFNGRRAAPRAWKRVADQELKRLEAAGIDKSRMKIIYGGEEKETKVQQWILHKDQPPPVVADMNEPLPAKAVQLQTLTDHELSEESESWSFESLLDVLRAHEKMRAVLIVRASPTEVTENFEAVEPVFETFDPERIADLLPEPPKAVDLLKVAEKWKAQLIETHKIPMERVVVLFAKPRDDQGNLVETWVVPAGAELPDPDATPESEEEESPAENEKKDPPVLP